MMQNTQHGPQHATEALEGVVRDASYKDGWRVWLDYKTRKTEHYAGSEGLTLCIGATVPDSTRPGEVTPVEHWMAPPPTSWSRAAWIRWLFDQLMLVETHEAMEFYSVAGEKPFFPAHGPGANPYDVEWRVSCESA